MSQYFKIDLYSHHFTLTQVQPRGREVIEKFAKNYVQMGMVKVGRKFIRAPIKVFGTRVANYLEYRFHINQYAEFTRHLSNNEVLPHTYEVTQHVAEPGVKTGIATLPQWTARDYQLPIIDYLVSPKPIQAKLVEIQTGKGKATSLDAKIKIPGGWTTMGQIKLGDTVTAWDGTPTKVVGVFPQGELQLYRVTFADGRSVECCAEHLWRVYYINTVPNRRWRIVDTMEMLRLISMPNPRVYVQLIEPEDCPAVSLPIHPYLLGVILGDGNTTTSGVSITKSDQELFDHIRDILPEDVTLVKRDKSTRGETLTYGLSKIAGFQNSLVNALKELNLKGMKSHEKFVPEQYLNASANQRLEILQGLMDTDGTANSLETGGAISFCSTSLQLAKDVQYLVRSLGGIASISTRKPKYSYQGELREGRDAYQVNIRMKTPSMLFTLSRKKERTNDENQYAKDLKLRVMSIEPSRVAQAQCISIDHPDRLYVTDDFIVTHNTFCAMKAAAELGMRIGIVIKPAYIDKWIGDDKRIGDVQAILGLTRKDIEVVQGSGQLMSLIAAATAGTLEAKVIIFSNKTLQNWFTLYERKGVHLLEHGYDCFPQELFQVCKIGLRLIDEVHQDFHLNFKLDLYTHVYWSISLSATLRADDPFMNRMYEVAYPKGMRFAGLAYDKYIAAFSVLYRLDKPGLVKTTEWGSTTYSHHAFEKSIIKNPQMLANFLEFIASMVRRFYLMTPEHVKGDRCLVYCSSIQMCTLVAEYLRKAIDGKDIRRYCEDDDYDNLMSADISVSTLLSAGTGHDIANLTTVILSTAIMSSQSNIQGFGRLRNLQGKAMRFAYLVCSDIPKHIEYHEKKKLLLAEMAKSYTSIPYPPFI